MLGAQGRDRTTDTAIFSRMLYQLSYLGISLAAGGLGAGVYSQAGQPCPPRFACGFAWRSHADSRKAERARRSPEGEDGLRRGALIAAENTRNIANPASSSSPRHGREWHRNRTASGSGRRPGSARNKTGARPRWRACRRSGTSWPMPCRRSLAFGRPLAGAGVFCRLSWHSTSRSGSENPRRRAARSIRTAAGPRHWCRSRPS